MTDMLNLFDNTALIPRHFEGKTVDPGAGSGSRTGVYTGAGIERDSLPRR